MKLLKLRLLSSMYLVSLCLSLSLLWLLHGSVRSDLREKMPKTRKRQWQALRISAKQGAVDLGPMIVWFALIPAIVGGMLFQSTLPTLYAAVAGFGIFTLLPLAMPAPPDRERWHG